MFSAGSGFWKRRRSWILPVAIWGSIAVILAIAVFCFIYHINSAFNLLYFFPLVLVGYYYRCRGIPLIFILSGIYFALAVFFVYPSVIEIEFAGLRAGMFIIIGVIIAMLSDNLERKSLDLRLAIENLRKSEEDFRNLSNQMINGSAFHEIIYDLSGNPVDYRILEVNMAFERILGINRNDVIGKTSREAYSIDTPPFLDLYGRVAASGQPEVFEEYFPPMKKHFAISVYSSGKGRFVTIFEDITTRRQADRALRESEEKFRGIFDTINDGIHIHEIESDGKPGKFVEVNEVACRMLQYTREELLQFGPLDFVSGSHSKPLPEITKELSTVGQSIFETEHRRKDGTIVPVEINAHVSFLGGRKVVVAVIRDITDRKKAEKALEETRKTLAEAQKIAHLGSFEYFAVTRTTVWSEEEYRIYGLDPAGPSPEYDEMLKKYVHPDDATLLHETFTTAMRNRSMYELEHRIIRPDGSVRWVYNRANPYFADDGTLIRYVGTTLDITDRKLVEEALRESEEKYRTLFDNMAEGLAYCRMIYDDKGQSIDFIYLAVNDVFNRIIGADVVLGKPVTKVFPGIRSAFPELFEIYGRVARTRKPESFDLDFTPSKKLLHISVYSPEEEFFVAVFSDITESRQAEKALRKSEENLRESQKRLASAMDIAHLVNWEFDVASGMFTFDDRFYALYGSNADREGGNLMSAETYMQQFVYPEDRQNVLGEIQKLLVTKDPAYTGQLEHRITPRDGSVRTIIARYAPVMGPDGTVIRTYGANQDITERKEMENALRESRHQLFDIISFLPDPTFVIDNKGKVISWNLAIQNLSGIPPEAILGKGDYEYAFRLFGERRPLLIDLVIHMDSEELQKHYKNTRQDGKILSGQFHVHSLLGKPADLWIVATPLFNQTGEIAGAIESIRDITAIKKTENDLKELTHTLEQRVQDRTRELDDARTYTRSLIEADLDPLVLIGTDGRIKDVNKAGEKITGLGRDLLLGTPFLDYVENKEQAQSGFDAVLKDGKVIGSRYIILHLDGHGTPVISGSNLFRDSDGSVNGVFVTLHDITQILHDEQLITDQLKEKEILLREVHHRVKNNLQIIISLINLQSKIIHDPAVVESLRDTQNRVRAISLVHERLHMSKDLARIDFGAYLRYLSRSLFAFYQKDPATLSLIFDAENIVLDVDTAAPLGLIFNELISNMLKYAFPDGRKGECTISAHRDGQILTVSICDNGIGIPADFDWKNTRTLGLKLVQILIEQLRGTITLDHACGTCFSLTIPISEKIGEIHPVG
ncbi:PAS domain S-box protein [Methanoregula sp.]|uniref:PAS domain S-box protein n=1 Tax=Methanoregula sp. TaxID=2052170 RepID=UPI003C5121B4